MKRLFFLIFATYSMICSAQEHTISIIQEGNERMAVVDQEIALTDTLTAVFGYTPKVGKLNYPTILINFNNLEDAFMRKSCEFGECTFSYLHITMYTSKGKVFYTAQPESKNIEHKMIDDTKSTRVIMILPFVHLDSAAKKTPAWGKKVKKALSEPNSIYSIELSTTITYYDPSVKTYRQKDVRYEIKAPLKYKLASLFTKLFSVGDKAFK